MPDLRELYQEVILDHGRRPRNLRAMPQADLTAEGHNPLCGDRLTVFVKMAENTLDEISFEGTGCAISVASASLMTEALRGKTPAETRRIWSAFRALVTGGPEAEAAAALLGKLVVFSGVREFPVRVKCASLPWHTLQAALSGQPESVSTE